jgi:hypothetical protein
MITWMLLLDFHQAIAFGLTHWETSISGSTKG